MAAPGVTLFLAGRDADRLEQTADGCRRSGATVRTARFDVTDVSESAAWVSGILSRGPLDLLVASAGITGGPASGACLETAEAMDAVLAVNLNGVVHVVVPAAEAMVARGRGAILLVSSLAALRGLPSSPAYSASKAAVRVLGEGLRGALADKGVGVTVACPGYVDTPMAQRLRGWKPFQCSPDQAARRMLRAVAKGRAEVAFPWPLVLGIRALSLVPDGVARRLLRFFAFSVRHS
jgi:short-subunit dehydrogenase